MSLTPANPHPFHPNTMMRTMVLHALFQLLAISYKTYRLKTISPTTRLTMKLSSVNKIFDTYSSFFLLVFFLPRGFQSLFCLCAFRFRCTLTKLFPLLARERPSGSGVLRAVFDFCVTYDAVFTPLFLLLINRFCDWLQPLVAEFWAVVWLDWLRQTEGCLDSAPS